MKLLLDTHVWLWSILTPERLSRRMRESASFPGERAVALADQPLGNTSVG